jgi:hypothetical protein
LVNSPFTNFAALAVTLIRRAAGLLSGCGYHAINGISLAAGLAAVNQRCDVRKLLARLWWFEDSFLSYV